MKEYRAKRSTVVLTIGFLVLITVLSVVGLLFAEPRWFFVVILFALAWEWYRHLRAPVRIVVNDDGAMRLRGLVSQIELHPKDITRIRRAGRYCSLEHGGKTTNLYANMEGLQEFLSGLQSANPEIDVKTFTWARKR
jgi:hypothetical protein